MQLQKAHENISNEEQGQRPTIHFDQQLIQSVLLFAVSSEASSASLPSHCIDFIDKKDAWSVLPSQSEHIANL